MIIDNKLLKNWKKIKINRIAGTFLNIIRLILYNKNKKQGDKNV